MVNPPTATPTPAVVRPRGMPSAEPVRRGVVVQVLVADERASIVSRPVHALELDFGGIVGDRHYGVARPANSRHAGLYPHGTLVRNRRQLTLVSVEELAQVAGRLQLPGVDPGLLGANLLVQGIPELSALPIGTRLLFPGGVGLVCEGVDQPCRQPARELQRRYPDSDADRRFVQVAFGRHGVVASVERPGRIAPGATVELVAPPEHGFRE